jgi:hypothetical protein
VVRPAPTRHIVLGAVVGLLVGGVAVGLPWLASGAGPDRSNATLACDALRRAEPVTAGDAVDAHLVGAAEQFSRAAATQDRAKQPLADAIRQLSNLVFYENQPAGSPELRAAVADVDEQCEVK